MVATETWPPNVQRARELLGSRGVEVVETSAGAPLPLCGRVARVATARHPAEPNWPEIHRVLKAGGYYFAQHVGPRSASELFEYFLGPAPAGESGDAIPQL